MRLFRSKLSVRLRICTRWAPSKRALASGRCRATRVEHVVPAEAPSRWTGVSEGYWNWKGYKIRYQYSGISGPPVLLVHGFGGNADHWRKNTPEIGKWGQAYAIDLLGYGYSDKPDPTLAEVNSIYNFDNWSEGPQAIIRHAEQLASFIEEKIGEPAFVVCNSVGGLAGLTLATQMPHHVRGAQLLNISLRKLHIKNQNSLARPLIAAFQRFLRTSPAGKAFFNQIANEQAVKRVLQQAYYDPSTVTDELVDVILRPGLQQGAVDVFLDFISYSSGPLPEDLIEACSVPLSIVWGAEDPWERVEWGRQLGKLPGVSEYIELAGVGHCPQDERPDLINPVIKKFVEAHL